MAYSEHFSWAGNGRACDASDTSGRAGNTGLWTVHCVGDRRRPLLLLLQSGRRLTIGDHKLNISTETLLNNLTQVATHTHTVKPLEMSTP